MQTRSQQAPVKRGAQAICLASWAEAVVLHPFPRTMRSSSPAVSSKHLPCPVTVTRGSCRLHAPSLHSPDLSLGNV